MHLLQAVHASLESILGPEPQLSTDLDKEARQGGRTYHGDNPPPRRHPGQSHGSLLESLGSESSFTLSHGRIVQVQSLVDDSPLPLPASRGSLWRAVTGDGLKAASFLPSSTDL